MSFKKQDEVTGIAEREIKGSQERASSEGQAPEALSEGLKLTVRQEMTKREFMRRSAKGSLPKTR